MAIADLSPTMQACVEYAQQHGGKLARYPGGFWCRAGLETWASPWFGTSTVEALVKRGVAEYTRRKDGKHGGFPIEVTIKP